MTAFRAYPTADQTGIASNTWTKVNCGQAAFTDGGYNSSSSAWTLSSSGNVGISGQVYIKTNAENTGNTTFAVIIVKNGTFSNGVLTGGTYITEGIGPKGSTTGTSTIQFNAIDNATAGDYYNICVYGTATAGHTLTLDSASTNTYFCGTTLP